MATAYGCAFRDPRFWAGIRPRNRYQKMPRCLTLVAYQWATKRCELADVKRARAPRRASDEQCNTAACARARDARTHHTMVCRYTMQRSLTTRVNNKPCASVRLLRARVALPIGGMVTVGEAARDGWRAHWCETMYRMHVVVDKHDDGPSVTQALRLNRAPLSGTKGRTEFRRDNTRSDVTCLRDQTSMASRP